MEIENYNCLDLCMEHHCSNHITHFVRKEINGMEVLLSFCEKHYWEFFEGGKN